VERVAGYLTRTKRIRVKNRAGTDLTMDVSGRKGRAITGICRKPGDAEGVPDIEAYIAPVENSVNGRLVIDGSTSVTGLAKNPLVLDIEQGRAKQIRGGAHAAQLVRILRRARSRNAFRVGEFGIGLNPLARIRGAIIEDEAALGTAHIALGDNHRFGGRNRAPIHVDLVLKAPRVELDGRVVLIGRRLLV
jgi:leucyl aminopeptidase (aminopeptidase T)